MFEEEKTKKGRRIAFSLLPSFPWVVKAYMLLLIVFISSYIIIGLLGTFYQIPSFNEAGTKMLGFIELIVGAVIGALTTVSRSKINHDHESE